VAGALALGCGVASSSAAGTSRVLRDADVSITVTSPTACEVAIALTVEGAPEVDHRVERFDGARIELLETRSAQLASAVRTIGRTESLVLRPETAGYSFRYRVEQPDTSSGRCPIWLPALPTDGRSRAVSIRIRLPPGSTPGPSMPAFDWTGTQGSTRLGHLPAFVRVPYAAEGESPGWDIGRVMDAVAILVFAAASAMWAWRTRR